MLKYLPLITFLSGMITSAAIAYAIVQYSVEKQHDKHVKDYHSYVISGAGTI